MSGTEVSKQGPAQTSVQGKLVRQTAIAAPSPDDFEKQAAAAKAAADAAAADAAAADAAAAAKAGGALAFSELKGGSQEQEQNQDYQHNAPSMGGRRRRQNSKKKSQHKKKHGGSKKHQNKSKKHQNKNKRQRGGK